MAGYSRSPLPRKLGIRENFRVLLINQPLNYLNYLGSMAKGVTFASSPTGELDFIQYFVTDKKELEKQFSVLKEVLKPDGCLWISWPKGGVREPTDLNENIIREIGLKNGLVDIKVAAIDNTWSGLKFIKKLS